MPSITPLPTTDTRLRQVALVAKDLQRARHLLTKVIGTEVVYVDAGVEQWGLKNILVAIGGDIIEVVSPFKTNTTASRLLQKRGDGGYMIIMQTLDAKARRSYLESAGLAKCIFMHESDDATCIQYHPKAIKGGMMPELDSHRPSSTNPRPLESPFSPWHACGPLSSYEIYSASMRRHSHLQLLSVTCRLKPGDTDIDGAAKQWESLFGLKARGGECELTNAKLKFLPGREGAPESLVEINIGVEGQKQLDAILNRAALEGLTVDQDGIFEMVGVRWRFEKLQTSVGSRL